MDLCSVQPRIFFFETADLFDSRVGQGERVFGDAHKVSRIACIRNKPSV